MIKPNNRASPEGMRSPFFLNCGEAATTTLGLKGRQTYEPSGCRPVNPKNLHTEGVSNGVSRALFLKIAAKPPPQPSA